MYGKGGWRGKVGDRVYETAHHSLTKRIGAPNGFLFCNKRRALAEADGNERTYNTQ